jgi:hypothetical protein
MLTGIHFLLTYACNFECDHCFLHCSPWSKGTFTIDQVEQVLDDAVNIDTMKWIFFEGGEPWLHFPLLAAGIAYARQKGIKTGVVTNAYGAVSKRDARLWLEPLIEAGLNYLSVSDDQFHYGEEQETPAAIAHAVARELGLDTDPICIDPPSVLEEAAASGNKGKPVVGGGARFRGRAVDKLTAGLPRRPWETLCACPDEDLESPSRVHIDAFGNVHICQGISMANLWETPLSVLDSTYRPEAHPICGPLLKGGPANLARALDFEPEVGYVDECHLCYLARRSVVDKFENTLTPRQVYGLDG